MNELELATRVRVETDPQSGEVILRIQDTYLNYSFAEQLKRTLKALCQEHLDTGVDRFVVDLTCVNVMDSCGLSVLIGLKKQVEGSEATLALRGLSPMVRRLFVLTKLERVFDLGPGPDAA